MTRNKARIFLLLPFLISLLLHLVAVVLVFQAGAIYRDNLNTLIPKILTIYSVHLAVIFGGIFAQQQSKRGRQVPATAFWIALTVITIWNLLLVWRSVTFGLTAFDIGDDRINDYVTYLETISSAGTFLVAGALAYFFSK